MISMKAIRSFCIKDFSKIENYEKAVADKTQIWHLHHRLETHKYKDRNRKEWIKRDENVSREELQAFGLYYNRPAEELIFVTHSEHRRLHNEGQQLSKETKQKISESLKGKPTWNKGKHHSEETKKKISKAHKGKSSWNKGKHHSESTKRKLSKVRKGKHWKLIDGKRVYY